jgi:hypothetical protein
VGTVASYLPREKVPPTTLDHSLHAESSWVPKLLSCFTVIGIDLQRQLTLPKVDVLPRQRTTSFLDYATYLCTHLPLSARFLSGLRSMRLRIISWRLKRRSTASSSLRTIISIVDYHGTIGRLKALAQIVRIYNKPIARVGFVLFDFAVSQDSPCPCCNTPLPNADLEAKAGHLLAIVNGLQLRVSYGYLPA